MNRRFLLALIATVAGASAAQAQGLPPSQGQNANPVCIRLEAQLVAVERGNADPNQRRYDDAAARQQADLDRVVAQSRRLGCEGAGLFSLFTGQNAQCGPINAQIQQIRNNLDRTLADQQRSQGGASADREAQRANLLGALAQNNCGPQYRAALNPSRGSLMDTLFGTGNNNGGWGSGDGSTFKTVCVRTCDGYYFPISFSATPARFRDDEQVCQRTCPGAEAVLFTHRNPGEDINRAVSINGKPYTELPNAFKYRNEFNNTCSCRRAGQSWADALGGKDDTVEQGDIVVTTERAKAMSQPARSQRDSRKSDPATIAPPPAPAADTPPAKSGEKKSVRTVGPVYLPTR